MHLLPGNSPFEWTSACQEAFDKLKSLITNAPILSNPNSHHKFCLECHASKYALGAVSSQHQDNKWKPISFVSKAFTPTH
jgi:hypothetical protein